MASTTDFRKALYKNKFPDSACLNFGDSKDVTMQWDGTDFHVTPLATNSILHIGTGTYSFDVKIYGSAAANVQTFDCSANTWTWGTTAAHIASATAGVVFDDRVHECSATSGSAYGFKQRMYLTGAAGSGAAGRFYTLGYGVAVANAYGIEATMEYHSPTTTITGLAAAGKFNVIAGLNTSGTCTVLDLSYTVAENQSAGHASDSYIRVSESLGSSATGCKNLFSLAVPGAKDTGAMFLARHADCTATHAIQIVDAAGTNYWLMVTTDTPAN